MGIALLSMVPQKSHAYVVTLHGPAVVCKNTSQTFDATAMGGPFNLESKTYSLWYFWKVYKDNVLIFSEPAPTPFDYKRTFTYTFTGDGEYVVEVGGQLGSREDADSKIVRVGIENAPVWEFRPSIICGSNLTYIVHPLAGATSYTWEIPSTFTMNTSGATTTNTVNGRTTYTGLPRQVSINPQGSSGTTATVRVKGVGACGESPVIYAVGEYPPQPTITGNQSPCPNTMVTYTASSGSNYTWSSYGGATLYSSYHNTAEYSMPNGANGYIRVDFTDVCGNPAMVFLGYGVQQYCYNSYYAVSPNPSTDEFKVENTGTPEGAEGEEFEVKLYNSLNKEVKAGKTKKKSLKFDVRDLPKGVYYLHIITKDNVEKRQHLIK